MDRPYERRALAEDGLSDSPAGRFAHGGGVWHEGGGGPGIEGSSSQQYLHALTINSKIKTAQMLRGAATPVTTPKVAWAQGSHAGSNASSPGRGLSISTLGGGPPPVPTPVPEGRLHRRIAELEQQLIEEGGRSREMEAYARTKEKQVYAPLLSPPRWRLWAHRDFGPAASRAGTLCFPRGQARGLIRPGDARVAGRGAVKGSCTVLGRIA